MKKVAYVNSEYNASLPPYRFVPGDVIEIDDAWADQLVQRGIARPAKSNAKTVQQIRIDARPPVPTPADERASRRAALEAELAALDRAEAASVEPYEEDDGGHYGDMVTRGDSAGESDPPPFDAPHAQSSGRKK